MDQFRLGSPEKFDDLFDNFGTSAKDFISGLFSVYDDPVLARGFEDLFTEPLERVGDTGVA
jgi:hypothetical protein